MPDRQELSDQGSRPTPSLLAKIADELRHNDECGPGPLSDDEYMDDARAILRIVDEHKTTGRDRLRAENERLREINEQLVFSERRLTAQRSTAVADNERLRAALREIAGVPVASPPDPVAMAEMRRIAALALDEQEATS